MTRRALSIQIIFCFIFKITVILCTEMQCIKTQVFGNRCTIKQAFWTFIYLDLSRILVYQYTISYIPLESE